MSTAPCRVRDQNNAAHNNNVPQDMRLVAHKVRVYSNVLNQLTKERYVVVNTQIPPPMAKPTQVMPRHSGS